MYRNNFRRLFAKIWPKNIISRDGCVLLIEIETEMAATSNRCDFKLLRVGFDIAKRFGHLRALAHELGTPMLDPKARCSADKWNRGSLEVWARPGMRGRPE